MIRKVVRMTTCNTGKARDVFDALVSSGIELNGRQVQVNPLNNDVTDNRYEASCRIWGQEEQKINEQCKALAESMLAYCISNGVGCSSIRFINETESVVEGRRCVRCQYVPTDEEEQLAIR
ncbi:MAG: hypothetical protein PWQ52_319 [Methanolobus sp.]|nr:hypothetical protein [Methanolobus sp.]